jgi:hypothetical protein
MTREKIYWPTLEKEAMEQLAAMPWWRQNLEVIAFWIAICAMLVGYWI